MSGGPDVITTVFPRYRRRWESQRKKCHNRSSNERGKEGGKEKGVRERETEGEKLRDLKMS